MTENRYHMRLTLPAGLALHAIVQILHQSKEDDYYVYERPPCWYVALGQQASMSIDASGTQVRVVSATGTHCRPIMDAETPADIARRFLAEHAPHAARVFGEAGFHYALRTRGHPFTPGNWPLLTLTVPRDEIVFGSDNVTVFAHDNEHCLQLCDWVQSAISVVQQQARAAAASVYALDLSVPDHDYCQRVVQAQQDIDQERYSKVILSRVMPLPTPLDIPATLLNGRQANTPARTFLLRQGAREAVGFSPELVMAVEQGRVVTNPLAGTHRRRGDTSEESVDTALLNDAKEVIEHVITVKAALDELNRVCEPESVVINDLMSICERGSVRHLASRVSGQLAPDKDAWDAFDVLFPGITASGVPKTPALAAISRLETAPRELYSGAILLLEAQTRFEAALVLRSAFQDGERQWIQAGAGIIAQSTPARELMETREKLSSIAPHLVARKSTHE